MIDLWINSCTGTCEVDEDGMVSEFRVVRAEQLLTVPVVLRDIRTLQCGDYMADALDLTQLYQYRLSHEFTRQH